MAGPQDWLDGLVGLAAPGPQERVARLATVHSGHTASATSARVVFDGETVATSKAYRLLQTVQAGQRVVMLRVGSSYVVLGALL